MHLIISELKLKKPFMIERVSKIDPSFISYVEYGWSNYLLGKSDVNSDPRFDIHWFLTYM